MCLNPGDATAIYGYESKKAFLAVFSEWEGWWCSISGQSIRATPTSHGHVGARVCKKEQFAADVVAGLMRLRGSTHQPSPSSGGGGHVTGQRYLWVGSGSDKNQKEKDFFF